MSLTNLIFQFMKLKISYLNKGEKMKKEIKIASIKGHFVGHLNEYLKQIGIRETISNKNRKLKHSFDLNNDYKVSIVLLRWEEMKKYSKEFDLLLFGSDQWLENGLKSIVILDSFKQGDCKLSVMSQSKFFDPNKNVATSFPSVVASYLDIEPSKIKYLSGSVEAAHYLGLADQIVDIVETGDSAKDNGYNEVKKVMSIDAVVGTTHLNKIPLFKELGFIKEQKNVVNIAFDGNDNSGKSTLAKHFAINRFNSNPSVLVCPYSGYVGAESMAFLENEDPKNWFINVGSNHWRPSIHVNAIYDRNILTGLTELIDVYSTNEILSMIKTWSPLPDILFYCAPSLDVVIKRSESRDEKDIYDENESLIDYHYKYEKAFNFVKDNLNINIVKLNTNNNIENNIKEINQIIKKDKK